MLVALAGKSLRSFLCFYAIDIDQFQWRESSVVSTIRVQNINIKKGVFTYVTHSRRKNRPHR